MKWNEGRLQNAKISSKTGGKCLIEYAGKQQEIIFKKGEERELAF